MTERIRLLEELGESLARAVAGAEQSHTPSARVARRLLAGSRGRVVAAILATTLLLAGTAYAVPATRTALHDITDSLSAWVAGDEDSAPGRAVAPGDNTPAWLSERASSKTRVIAEAGGVGLFVTTYDTDRGTMFAFSLGAGFTVDAGLEYWRRRLDQHTVVVLGYSILRGPRRIVDDQGRLPLFGVTTRDVDRVELRYVKGPPLVSANGDGGFVLLVDAWRPMREIVAYDATGRMLGRADVSRYDLRHECEKQPGCPPTSP